MPWNVPGQMDQKSKNLKRIKTRMVKKSDKEFALNGVHLFASWRDYSME